MSGHGPVSDAARARPWFMQKRSVSPRGRSAHLRLVHGGAASRAPEPPSALLDDPPSGPPVPRDTAGEAALPAPTATDRDELVVRAVNAVLMGFATTPEVITPLSLWLADKDEVGSGQLLAEAARLVASEPGLTPRQRRLGLSYIGAWLDRILAAP